REFANPDWYFCKRVQIEASCCLFENALLFSESLRAQNRRQHIVDIFLESLHWIFWQLMSEDFIEIGVGSALRLQHAIFRPQDRCGCLDIRPRLLAVQPFRGCELPCHLLARILSFRLAALPGKSQPLEGQLELKCVGLFEALLCSVQHNCSTDIVVDLI